MTVSSLCTLSGKRKWGAGDGDGMGSIYEDLGPGGVTGLGTALEVAAGGDSLKADIGEREEVLRDKSAGGDTDYGVAG